VKVWDARGSWSILTFAGHRDIQGETARLWSVALSPDGKRVASGSYDDTVTVWDAWTGDELLSLKGGIRGGAFSPDGNRRASADGLALRLMSWRDGSWVPTSGNNVVMVGTDNNGLLHIRIFDAAGRRTADSNETQLPARAAAIATLKQQLPGLLPPHVLTEAE